jgi:hypothetical protein
MAGRKREGRAQKEKRGAPVSEAGNVIDERNRLREASQPFT